MAYVRPPRKSKVTRVDDDEEPELINPTRDEKPTGLFADYDQMHSKTFKPAGDKPANKNSVEGVQVANLESLVRTLASLQFTTKGKIDADGKVEIVFCSPEPIVMEEKVAPTVRFVKPDLPQESTPRRKHRHRERRLLF
jgi:hypothetical protein